MNTDKLTYSIGQVSEITDIAQSTLRYWETVIDSLVPIKTPGGSRRYTQENIELIAIIKDILHNQGFTIKGANLYLKNNIPKETSKKEKPAQKPVETQDVDTYKINLNYIKNELVKIKKILG